tara:strand:+ start:7587 stop:12431 length:4845 start_codon:yes stop_codon:yes gene_type:complete
MPSQYSQFSFSYPASSPVYSDTMYLQRGSGAITDATTIWSIGDEPYECVVGLDSSDRKIWQITDSGSIVASSNANAEYPWLGEYTGTWTNVTFTLPTITKKSVPYKDFKKFGDEFSITQKYSDYIGNDSWRKGFELAKAGGDLENQYTTFWKFVSAMSEDTGSKIYSKIKHLNQNIRDIDTCEVTYLAGLAYELGYTGNLDFLSFEYPTEIHELINIFSINKNLLLKTPKVLAKSTREKIWGVISGTQPSDLFSNYQYSTMSKYASAYTNIVSDIPSAIYYTDDNKYQDLVDDVFTDCLSSFVSLKYRENELALSGKPIWKSISEEIADVALYGTQDKKTNSIEQAKSDLGIKGLFRERAIVDAIQENKDSFDNYTKSENIILNLELARREKTRTKYSNVSRYAPERERVVKSYFKFIDRMNSDISTAFNVYTPDTQYFEISGGTNLLLKYENNAYVLDEDVLIRTSKKLRNLCFKISYFREELKRIVRKHNLTGTNLIIKILTKDFMRKYIYNHSENWRFTGDGQELMSTKEISELPNFDIDIVEYYDTTEYMNISAVEAQYVTASALNDRYWEPSLSGTRSDEIPSGKIVDFYRNIVGLDLNTTDNDEYYLSLTDFLNTIFNAGAAYQTEDSITTTLTSLISRPKNLVLDEEPETSKGNLMNKYVQKQSTSKLNDVYTNANNPSGWVRDHFHGTYGTSDSYTEITTAGLSAGSQYGGFLSSVPSGRDEYGVGGYFAEQEVVSAFNAVYIGLSGNLPKNQKGYTAAHLHLSTQPATSAVGDLYYFQAYSYVNFYPGDRSTKLVISGPSPATTYLSTDTSLSAVSAYYTPVVIDLPAVTGAPFRPINGYFWAASGAQTSAYSIYLSSVASGDLMDVASHAALSGVRQNGVGLAGIAVNRVLTAGSPAIIDTITLDNGSEIFQKYSGKPIGVAPYVNFKNKNTASYAIHPYINNIVEKRKDGFNLVTDAIDYEAEGTSTSYLSTNIVNQIDLSGRTTNSWRKENIENIGYQTKYEQSTNYDTLTITNSAMDIDGPFNYDALNKFITAASSDAWFVANSAIYYGDLGLTDQELTRIKSQLSTYRNQILDLVNKVIYKYSTDVYENHYILYKDSDKFSEVGTLFLRKNDHPLPLPAIDLNISRNTNNSLANLNTNLHSQINVFGNDIFDFGFHIDTMYIVTENPFNPKVHIGLIEQEFNSTTNYNETKFIRNTSHDLEFIQVPEGNKFAGVNVIENILNVVSVNSDRGYGLPRADTPYSEYSLQPFYQLFDPDTQGYFVQTGNGAVCCFNEAYPFINTFKSTFTNEILSIGFESEAVTGTIYNFPGKKTFEGGLNTDRYNDTFLTRTSGYSQLSLPDFNISGTTFYKKSENSITVVDYDLNDQPYGKEIRQNTSPTYLGQESIHYFYPGADLAHYSSYPGKRGATKYWKYRNTSIPPLALTGDISGVISGIGISDTTDHSYLDLRSFTPSAINIQCFQDKFRLSANVFEVISGLPISASRGYERIKTAGGLDVNTINLSSRDFNFVYYPTNGINSRGYKIRTNLFVRDEVSKNGKLTPDDLSYGETGEVITYEQDEFADRDYFIMTDYRFKVTDFKKMKIRVEAELPNWSEDNEYEY